MPQKCFQHVLGVGDTSSSKAKLLAFVEGLRASDCLLVTTTLRRPGSSRPAAKLNPPCGLSLLSSQAWFVATTSTSRPHAKPNGSV